MAPLEEYGSMESRVFPSCATYCAKSRLKPSRTLRELGVSRPETRLGRRLRHLPVMIGVADRADGFHVRQFLCAIFPRASALAALDESHVKVLVTYNGKSRHPAARAALLVSARVRRLGWRISICCTARGACGDSASKAAAWWRSRIRSWVTSARTTSLAS